MTARALSARCYVPGLVFLSASLVACNTGEAGPGTQPRALPATATYHLLTTSDDPIGPLIMLESGDSGAVGFDVPTKTAWFFSTDTTRGFHKIREVAWLNGSKVLAAARWRDTLALLDKRGYFARTSVTNPDARIEVMSLDARAGSRVLSMHRLSSGVWVYSREYAGFGADGSIIDSVVLATITDSGTVTTLLGVEKAGPERPTVLLTDYMSTSSRGDTVWIAGSDPPRVYTWTPEVTELPEPVTLEDTPRRPVPSRERWEIQQSLGLNSAVILARAEIPRYYPPIVKVLPLGTATLVVGGAGKTAFALDLYCGNSFTENIAFSPSILDITLTDTGVWIQEAAEDGSEVTLSYAPTSALTAGCERQ